MAGERYTQEFKIAAVKQVTQEGHSILGDLVLPVKASITGGQGMAIMRQLTKPHRLKKVS